MAIKRVFKSSITSCKYIFQSGKEAIFIGGEYYTNVESEIKELEEEILACHPHIKIDENKREIDTEADPLKGIKEKAVADYLAAMSAAVDPTNDMGSTETTKLKGILNTQTLNKVMVGSTSGTATIVAPKA